MIWRCDTFPALPQTHLAIAGESGVVKQEVGTKEEDDGVEYAQARPIHEDGPAEEGVLCYVPDVSVQRGGGGVNRRIHQRHKLLLLRGGSLPIQGRIPLQCLHGDMLLHQAVEKDGERGEADVVQRQVGSVVQRLQGKDEERKSLRGNENKRGWRVWTVYIPAARTHKRTDRGTEGRWSTRSGEM